MDFALDTSETPSRAFTLDVIEDVGTRQSAFNIQQFYVGIGGVAGNWKKTLLNITRIITSIAKIKNGNYSSFESTISDGLSQI